MGKKESEFVTKGLTKSKNDFELVVRTSKELEYIIEKYLAGQGTGLHQLTNSVEEEISPYLARKLHYIATIRNKIVHEPDFNSVPDRKSYIEAFDEVQKELARTIEQSHSTLYGGDKKKKSSRCVIM